VEALPPAEVEVEALPPAEVALEVALVQETLDGIVKLLLNVKSAHYKAIEKLGMSIMYEIQLHRELTWYNWSSPPSKTI